MNSSADSKSPVQTGLANRIREARLNATPRITQRQLATLLRQHGYPRANPDSISHWERGRHIPDRALPHLRAVLGIETDDV